MTKLNPTGSALVYSTYLGGSAGDLAYGLAVDGFGNAYVTGYSGSGFPVTTGAFQTTYKGTIADVFVAKLNLSGTTQGATTTTLTASANPLAADDEVTFKAVVAAISGSAVPTGKVDFSVDGVAGATQTLDSSGTAYWSTSGLAPGTHSVQASYEGNSTFASSYNTLTETITAPPPFTSNVTVSGGPVAAGGTATLTATVSGNGSSITPTGTVTFTTGTTTLGTAPLISGLATLPGIAATAANGLGTGSDLVTASYSGDANFQSSMGYLDLLVYDPSAPPPLLSLSPSSATAGSGSFTLTVNGANFDTGSVVLWNGSVGKTTYVSSTQLTATILAVDIAKEGTYLVTVANPAPNAATSAAQPFVVMSSTPVATISGASISDAADGSGNHLLTLTGTDFVSNSMVNWDDGGLATTYVSPWQIVAVVTASEYAARPAAVTVNNPAGASPSFELR